MKVVASFHTGEETPETAYVLLLRLRQDCFSFNSFFLSQFKLDLVKFAS